MQVKKIHIEPGCYEGVLQGDIVTLKSAPFIKIELERAVNVERFSVYIQVFDTGAVHIL